MDVASKVILKMILGHTVNSTAESCVIYLFIIDFPEVEGCSPRCYILVLVSVLFQCLVDPSKLFLERSAGV